jgi:YidC/Oxa1 family membrane protein insertase
MNTDVKRIFLASVLIFIILMLQPYYLNWLGIGAVKPAEEKIVNEGASPPIQRTVEPPISLPIQKRTNSVPIQEYVVETDLFTAVFSNQGGGSFNSLLLKEQNSKGFRYLGSFGEGSEYISDEPVLLTSMEGSGCTPCLSAYDAQIDEHIKYDLPFSPSINGLPSRVTLTGDDSYTFSFFHVDEGGYEIRKSITFFGSSYETVHSFNLNNNINFPGEDLELMWAGGLRPTEKTHDDDVTYASAIAGQSSETEEISLTSPDENLERSVLDGNTDWVSIRSKYFTAALIADTPGTYAALESHNADFAGRKITPVYTAGIGFDPEISTISSRVYFGPLDLDYISLTGTSLDETMNFGFTLIRPIGKGILWFLKFLHNTLKLNYGFVLILFALLVRFITGPLTRKSFESSQKMQTVQPLVKKIQAKYKNDSQKMNQEVMALYREKGVNPLGGCLPILLQMPLLWALFVVFRSTIEFRGAGFMLWIKDLSQPDIIMHLPFNIPIYGGHIAILPILMGFSIFLTQRMSMATMDKAQRPMMYIMNAFFVLLFNQFPSGLNLYYTVYNLLNFFQQRSIRLAAEGA